jgi:dihydroorotase
MNSFLIRDIVIFGPEGRVRGDCLVENGRIARVGDVDAPANDLSDSSHDSSTAPTEIDGKGRWLWPGAIDAHVHFRDPGPTYKEDWETGSSAAVAGGVTSVFEMPNTQPTTTTVARLAEKRALASEKSRCNFGLFFGAGLQNHREIHKAEGVPGLKIFMGCSTGDLLVYREEDLDEVFAAWSSTPGSQPICVHAESELRLRERTQMFKDRRDPAVHSEIRDPRAAAEAVRLACRLALDHGCNLHILHLSTTDELDEVERARDEAARHGLRTRITCEVCPHHLFLNTDAYQTQGTRVRMNPPLRAEEQRAAMWDALKDGRIQMVATDHAPHTLEEKDRPYWEAPSGVPGVETMLPLLLDAAHRGQCSYEDVLQWVCHGPAEVYGAVDRGRIEPGHWADLVLIDPEMEREVRDEDQFTRCAWSPWSGRTLRGWPLLTWVNGQLAFERNDAGRGAVVGAAGMGMEVEFPD